MPTYTFTFEFSTDKPISPEDRDDLNEALRQVHAWMGERDSYDAQILTTSWSVPREVRDE